MKLEKPILFHTVEELQEAAKYGIIRKAQIVLYEEEEYSLPTLFWNLENGELEHQGDNKVMLDQDDEFLPILRKSVDWKDVREQYKPKEWYELESSSGKAVWVRDNDFQEWTINILKEYDKFSNFPFVCRSSQWAQAEPVTVKDLI